MTKIIEGDLILEKDTVFDESLEVHGSILGKYGNRYNLKVNGNISAGDIIAMDIIAWDITAGNINAKDINAVNIDARNINAINIYAEDIDAEDIDAVDIKARDIDANDITAGNITAWNIIACNITAGNITANDINANDITARNINADFILCEKLVQKPGSTLTARKVINNRSSYNQSAIDNSQFIKQKQEKCDACGQVRRGKKPDKLSEKLK